MNRQFLRSEREQNPMVKTVSSLNSTSQGSTKQMYFSQYLSRKNQGIRENNSFNYTYDQEQLREKCDHLQQQLEEKEQFISEMRQCRQKNQTENNQDSHDQNGITETTSNGQQIQLLQSKIKQLEKELQMLNKEHQFAQSITKLVQQCQPLQQNRPPSYKECWNWLKQLLDEYVQLKNQK